MTDKKRQLAEFMVGQGRADTEQWAGKQEGPHQTGPRGIGIN